MSRLVFRSFCGTAAACVGLALLPASALAAPGARVVQNPNHVPNPDAVVLDFRSPQARAKNFEPAYPATPDFHELNRFANDAPDPDFAPTMEPHRMPGGMAQIGTMVVPDEMLDGAEMVSDATATLTDPGSPSHGGGGAPDIDEICAFPDEVPPGIYSYDARPGGETPRFHTVYLNYVGATLTANGENSAENQSGIARSNHPYPVYAGGEMLAIAAAQAVAADFEDLAVRIVYEQRPPKILPYTMVMMGGHYSDTTAGPSGGVAPLDCEDFGQRNVCYVFQNTSPASTQANIASQEIGHTMGLGHTTATDSVMASGYSQTQPGDLGFNNTCTNTINVSDQGSACTGVNRCHCGVPDQQDDKRTLGVIFAPAGVDMIEPTIEITSPEDGASYPPGSDVIIEVDPWDDVGGYGWKLTLEDETGELLADKVDYDKALEFKLIGVPEGTYTATAHIQDHADHVTTHAITFVVEAAAGETGGEGSSGGEGDTDSAGEGADGSSGDGGSDSDSDSAGTGGSGGADTDSGTGGANAADDGCGCSQSPASGGWSLLALFGLAFWRRRA